MDGQEDALYGSVKAAGACDAALSAVAGTQGGLVVGLDEVVVEYYLGGVEVVWIGHFEAGPAAESEMEVGKRVAEDVMLDVRGSFQEVTYHMIDGIVVLGEYMELAMRVVIADGKHSLEIVFVLHTASDMPTELIDRLAISVYLTKEPVAVNLEDCRVDGAGVADCLVTNAML